MGQQNQYLQNGSSQADFSPISCACNEISLMFRNMSVSLKKVQFKMCSDSNNKSLNAEFMSHSSFSKVNVSSHTQLEKNDILIKTFSHLKSQTC